MRFSESWLREWVNPDITSAQLQAQLTMAGLEVDAAEPAAPSLDGVVVGRVIRVEPHPHADRLKVCQVDVGGGETVTIVCGAANVAAGMRVPAARAGATLPGGAQIRTASLRGVESQGMLCSARELGLAESADGLMDLPPDCAPGTPLSDALQLDDTVIELGLTPNRGDCLGIIGIAREVAAINRMPLDLPAEPAVAVTADTRLEVTVAAPQACPRYLGRALCGIRTGARTPLWMQEKLRRCGLRSIHPVVDVTNFVMLELGQPMHAFDLGKIHGEIVVRYAQAGERLRLLDGQEKEVDEQTLVIADRKQVHALAGIMGGMDGAVDEHSSDLFLECAFFTPQALAGKARRYGLHTDSSHRFERGVDPQIQHLAMARATALLLEIVGGRAGPLCEFVAEAHLPVRAPIRLRQARLERLLGLPLPAEEIVTALQRLGMAVEPDGDGVWQVTPPSFRFDIAIEADLVEEVGRLVGYDRIPTSACKAPVRLNGVPEAAVSPLRVAQLLVDRGYQEVITYGFVDRERQHRLNPDLHAVVLANPIAADLAVMRTSLWPGLIKALQYNMNRQQDRLRLFESGVVFLQTAEGVQERAMVGGVVVGSVLPRQWGVPSRKADFFDVKGDVEQILALTNRSEEFIFESRPHPSLHPGQSSAIVDRGSGEIAGWLGVLHPEVTKELDIDGDPVVFELALASTLVGRVPHFAEISKFPAIRRDLALVVDESVTARSLLESISQVAGATLAGLEIFDVYRGKGIDSGRKSLALGLTLQDTVRTLTDADVDSLVNRILERLKSEFRAELRD